MRPWKHGRVLRGNLERFAPEEVQGIWIA